MVREGKGEIIIKIKTGASIDDCNPDILLALIKVAPIYARQGVDTVVTSGSEHYKHHAVRSAHYRGDAIDLRIKNIDAIKRGNVLAAIKRKLGPHYVVLHEGKGKPWEHIHMHYSPIYRP